MYVSIVYPVNFTCKLCVYFVYFSSHSVKFSHDSRLRNAAVDVYSTLYGRLTPTCLPQGVGGVSCPYQTLHGNMHLSLLVIGSLGNESCWGHRVKEHPLEYLEGSKSDF